VWNAPVDTLPVAANSLTLTTSVGLSKTMHADFGSGLYQGAIIGIPFVTVAGTQTKYPVSFDIADESDVGPYAIPLNTTLEGGSDRHAIAVDTDNCILYELWAASPGSNNWTAGSGAIFDLKSNALRTDGFTSADAAGLPIFPGLVRYDEVASGQIQHAIRLTVPNTQKAYQWPARHYASNNTSTSVPAMGQRFRLRSNFDVSTYPSDVQVILRALQKYGLIVADNGSAWYISGAPDSRWDNSHLSMLSKVLGSDLEAVDDSVFMVRSSTGQAATCDSNDDGVVNATDVQAALNRILTGGSCGLLDLDGNGACSVVDLQRVINKSAGGPCKVGP